MKYRYMEMGMKFIKVTEGDRRFYLGRDNLRLIILDRYETLSMDHLVPTYYENNMTWKWIDRDYEFEIH